MKLIIEQKVAYLKLKLGSDNKSELQVVLRQEENLKFLCLYSSPQTDGQILTTVTNYEIQTKILSEFFG